MDWFLYDNGLRHERVKHYYLLHSARCSFFTFEKEWGRGGNKGTQA